MGLFFRRENRADDNKEVNDVIDESDLSVALLSAVEHKYNERSGIAITDSGGLHKHYSRGYRVAANKVISAGRG